VIMMMMTKGLKFLCCVINGRVLKFRLKICKSWSWCAEVTCWVITGERQAARIRSKYLKAILRQDVTFFDKETSTGEMVGRMAGDTVLIQDAIGEKVCIPNFFSFFCSSSPIGNSRIYYESDVWHWSSCLFILWKKSLNVLFMSINGCCSFSLFVEMYNEKN
jgi:ABC-type multidrug transport system fused ATPase/permease subunit